MRNLIFRCCLRQYHHFFCLLFNKVVTKKKRIQEDQRFRHSFWINRTKLFELTIKIVRSLLVFYSIQWIFSFLYVQPQLRNRKRMKRIKREWNSRDIWKLNLDEFLVRNDKKKRFIIHSLGPNMPYSHYYGLKYRSHIIF